MGFVNGFFLHISAGFFSGVRRWGLRRIGFEKPALKRHERKSDAVKH
jgi:hypothetical protein